jgi:multiple sugar transport system permease protein
MTLIAQPPQQADSPGVIPRPAIEAAGAASLWSRRSRRRSTPTTSPHQKLLIYILLCVGSLLFLIPFYFILNGSFKTDVDVQAGNVVSPPMHWADVQWKNYPSALSRDKMDVWPALSNTVVITTLSVVGQVLSCSLVGFGFARFAFRGRAILFMIMLSTMMLPAQVTMIPLFVLFRTLHMIDTFWPLVLPAWLASPFFVFMFRQFFSAIPEELIEAAKMDGASHWRIYWQLMLPLSGPVIAIVAIYTFLGTWNDFLSPLIYLNDPAKRTLALALNSFMGQYGLTDANLLMAASVVCMLPCVVLFFACQKYFVDSVAMTGGK